jgi:hypothetical protein
MHGNLGLGAPITIYAYLRTSRGGPLASLEDGIEVVDLLDRVWEAQVTGTAQGWMRE